MREQVKLTPRLREIGDMVPSGAALVDVGTDHGYLPVWLLQEGKVERAIASELREGPLSRARETAHETGWEEQMEFRLCNGLTGIRAGEVDTIVIAGMGGETMVNILTAAPWVKNPGILLLLQPMSTQTELRGWLWRSGFSIEEERLICEEKTLYNILKVRWGKPQKLSPIEEWAGKQHPDMNAPLRGAYLEQLLSKLDRALDGMSRAAQRDEERIAEMRVLRDGLENMQREWNAWQQ